MPSSFAFCRWRSSAGGFGQRDLLGVLERRNAVQQGILSRRVAHLGKLLHPLAGQVQRSNSCDSGPTISGRTPAPSRAGCLLPPAARASTAPHSRLVAAGIERDLLLKFFLGFFVAAQAQRQPCGLPVRVRSPRSVRESAAAIRGSVERLVVFVMHEMQIRDRQQRLLPATGSWAPSAAARRPCGRKSRSRPRPKQPRRECTDAARSVPASLPADWSASALASRLRPLRCSASASASSAAGRVFGSGVAASSRYSSAASL